jgi:hypothetical protein
MLTTSRIELLIYAKNTHTYAYNIFAAGLVCLINLEDCSLLGIYLRIRIGDEGRKPCVVKMLPWPKNLSFVNLPTNALHTIRHSNFVWKMECKHEN